MAKVKLPDGSALEVDNSITCRQLAEKIGPGLAKSAIAAKINGQSAVPEVCIYFDFDFFLLEKRR